MRYRVGPALLALALAVSMTAVALAQADDDTSTPDGTAPVETTVIPPIPDQPAALTFFLQVTDPVEQDVEVPLETARLTVTGATLPGAVVSVAGDFASTDDQGNFVVSAELEQGANELEVVASDSQGNQLTTTLFVVRGE
jgi:hypothetical protein